MKILIYSDSLSFGGLERTISYLSNNFISKGHQVIIVLNKNDVAYDINKKIKIYVVGDNSSKNVIHRILEIKHIKKQLIKIIKAESPDIIFTAFSRATFYARLFKSSATLITSERKNPQHNGFIRMLFKKWLFLNSNGIIFQTENAKQHYSKKIQNKSIVIQNAIGNIDLYNIQNNHNFNKNILAVGRLIKEKDYPTLLKAFKLVVESYPKYSLLIYGQGKEKEKLINYSVSLGIKDNVIFKGTDKDAIIKNINSTCYVLSSISEGMPNSLMEAMASGIPSISTNCNYGPSELIINGKNGLLVDVGDFKGLAKAIKSIISNEELAMRLSIESQKLKNTNSIEKISSEYLDFIIKTCIFYKNTNTKKGKR